MKQYFRGIFRDQEGSAMVITSLCLVVILGILALVVDVGLLFVTRTQLLRAAEASALAGAALIEAGENAVKAEAEDYLIKNGADLLRASIDVDPEKQLVKVNLEREVNFFFAPIYGRRSAVVTATAGAQNGSISAVKGVSPIGIEDQNLVFGQRYVLKWSSDSMIMDTPLGPGNFGMLDFTGGGGGSSEYRSYASNGYSKMLRVGDVVAAETGNKSGPTLQGFGERIANADPECTWQQIKPDCERILIIPVYQVVSASGSNQSYKIVGFSSFWLEEVKGQGNNSYVRGYFVKRHLPGEIDLEQNDYGLRSVKLVI